ncbi:glycosyltransferase family 2 protein [Oryzomonas rubra]|uniref:Glycosyltransferase family 2 protein n=1 Tax=Oryzomonas rubra TaxID=2509454 RepID=A0A5A9XQ82_9BACT|nr:glycosyltransferase family 2 protein [Oryzomonas rubra]KAA0895297.1 glycosyltransferase family 2 protein [Oryzomonas rubra]
MRSEQSLPAEPLVAIIIVNWNKRQCVISLLDSLRAIEYGNHLIVIVDNASTDDSIMSIREHELPALLIENSENLGGTGGFNTGMTTALRELEPTYLWLLDNDAEVLPGTLKVLVNLMESDKGIGIAGSCIMSPEDHGLIVEAGAFVGWRSGTSDPHLRYSRVDDWQGPRVMDVDSVAACSALVRAEAVRRVGIMDERYFLHWDDIDFCIRIGNAGYRVVACLDAPAFHGAEKGYSPITLYYDFRNALLFQGKHCQGWSLLVAAWNILGNYLASMTYLFLLGQRKPARYLQTALGDFLSRRFGRAATAPSELVSQAPFAASESGTQLGKCQKVVVFAVGSFDEVASAIRRVKSCGDSISVSVAVAADRAEVYRLPEVDAVITYDLFRSGLHEKIATALAILGGNFSCGVTAGGPFVVPYAFLLRRNFRFDGRTGVLGRLGVSLYTVWKLPFAIAAGKLLAVRYLFPVVSTCRSLRNEAGNYEPESAKGRQKMEESTAP